MLTPAINLPSLIWGPPTPSVVMEPYVPPRAHAPKCDLDLLVFPLGAVNSLAFGMWPEAHTKDVSTSFKPKTFLGAHLLELRKSYLARGGVLLSNDALEAELRMRREGVDND